MKKHIVLLLLLLAFLTLGLYLYSDLKRKGYYSYDYEYIGNVFCECEALHPAEDYLTKYLVCRRELAIRFYYIHIASLSREPDLNDVDLPQSLKDSITNLTMMLMNYVGDKCCCW